MRLLHHARICAQFRAGYRILDGAGERDARVSGRFAHHARTPADFPAVGDFVIAEYPQDGPAVIHELLPRKNAILRKAAGTAAIEQVVAANLDWLFVVSGLDGDFNVRRIERYVALARGSGVEPVIVLNKADLCADLAANLDDLETARLGAPIHVISALVADGIDSLGPYLQPGSTVALAGSSGAGKSTLANALRGDGLRATGAVRETDSRGRHTTTARELFALPGGAFLLDTPGMRELQLWEGDGIAAAFEDVEGFAQRCRFSDCSHDTEPACAVRGAIESGALDSAHFANYQKLRREQAHLERKVDAGAAARERERWKRIHRQAQEHMRFKRRQ